MKPMHRILAPLAICLVAFGAVWLYRCLADRYTAHLVIGSDRGGAVDIKLTLPSSESRFELIWPPSDGLAGVDWQVRGAQIEQPQSEFRLTLAVTGGQGSVEVSYTVPIASGAIVDLFAAIPRISPKPADWVIASSDRPLRVASIDQPMGSFLVSEQAWMGCHVETYGMFRLARQSSVDPPVALRLIVDYVSELLARDARSSSGTQCIDIIYNNSIGREVLAYSQGGAGPVVIPRVSSSALDLRLVARRLLATAPLHPSVPVWARHGLRELAVDRAVQYALQNTGRSSESDDYAIQVDEERWSRLAYIMPVDFDVDAGPAGLDGAWVDWVTCVCPLVAGRVVSRSDGDHGADGDHWAEVDPNVELNRMIWSRQAGFAKARRLEVTAGDLAFAGLKDVLVRDRLHVLVTAGMQGFLENCGCVVNQSGGAARRSAVAHAARAEGAIVVDAGGFSPAPRPDRVIDISKYMRTIGDCYSVAGFDCLVPSRRDLATSPEALTAFCKSGVNLVSANVRWPSNPVICSSRVVERDGRRVAIIGLSLGGGLERQYSHHITSTKHYIHDVAGTSVRAAISALRNSAVDRFLLVGHIPPGLALQMSQELPARSLIVSTDSIGIGGEAEVTGQQASSKRTKSLTASSFATPNGCAVIFVGPQSYWCSLVSIPDSGPVQGVESYTIWLNSAVPDHVKTKQIVDDFYKQCGDAMDWSVRLSLHDKSIASYVGSTACKTCHEAQWVQWKQTRHAGAYRTLLAAHRHFVPECVQCHVVALNREGGFSQHDQRDELQGVGCEVCHGPGSVHVASPAAANIGRSPDVSTCTVCHYGKHDPAFSADKMRSVEHACNRK